MIRAAFSPCPNDTVLFWAWAHGLVGDELPPEVSLGDIRQLNRWARQGTFDLCKVSFHALGHLLDDYVMLPVGAALGNGCGPKVIARQPFDLKELGSKRVGIPGEDTTAHLLLQLLAPDPKEKRFCLYHKMGDLLNRDEVDAAVIIHEQRFTFAQQGFVEIADLGQLWEERYGVPIPLGGLVVKRSLPNKERLIETLRASLDRGLNSFQEASPYVLQHAQEQSPQVVQQHIDLYVTEETSLLSAEGRSAVDTLLCLARERNLIPEVQDPWLFS